MLKTRLLINMGALASWCWGGGVEKETLLLVVWGIDFFSMRLKRHRTTVYAPKTLAFVDCQINYFHQISLQNLEEGEG